MLVTCAIVESPQVAADTGYYLRRSTWEMVGHGIEVYPPLDSEIDSLALVFICGEGQGGRYRE